MPSPRDLAVHVSIGVLSTFVVSWFNIRPLGILFLAGLVCWAYTMFCPCTLALENAQPIEAKLRGNFESFAKLRKDKPAAFCLIVSVALLLLMVLGHIVSGTWLVIGGLSVLGYVSSRHSVRVKVEKSATTDDRRRPPTAATQWGATASEAAAASAENKDADEFLPEVNESALNVLNLAGEAAILASAKSDGGDNDDDTVPMELLLLPDDVTVPDVEKEDENLSEEEEFGIQSQPATTTQRKQKYEKAVLTSDSDDEDEESLSRGLNFDEYSVVDSSQTRRVVGAEKAPQELTGMVTDFVSNMIPWNKVGSLITATGGGGDSQQQRRRVGGGGRGASVESSDDSEFEILNTDELKGFET